MPNPEPIDEGLRRRVAALLERDGQKATIDRLGISIPTLDRLLAGRPISTGTVAMVEKALTAKR